MRLGQLGTVHVVIEKLKLLAVFSPKKAKSSAIILLSNSRSSHPITEWGTKRQVDDQIPISLLADQVQRSF